VRNIKSGGSRNTIIILLLLLFLVLGGTGGYLLWRTNQEETVAPTESEASDQTNECHWCEGGCGVRPIAELKAWRDSGQPYNQSMKDRSDSSKGDVDAGYSIPSVVTIPEGVQGEMILYYKSLDGIMTPGFIFNDTHDFRMLNLDSNRRQIVRTGIQVNGGQSFTLSSDIKGHQDPPFAEGCPGSNWNKGASLGWIKPNSDNTCGSGFWGPPQGNQCCRYAKNSVASDIQWVQSTGHTIISQQCWGDWMEWKGDYDFNDYFLIIAVEEPQKPSVLSVEKHGVSVCNNNNTANPSATLTYTVTVKNTGDGDGEIKKIVDTLDSKVASTPTEISDGGIYSENNKTIMWTFTNPLTIPAKSEKKFTYKINVSKDKFGTYENKVVVTKGDDSTMEADATVPCTCNIVQPPNLSVEKRGISVCNNNNTANPSATLTYTITIKNTGTGKGEIKKIVDTLDSKVTSSPTDISDGGVYANGKITWTFTTPLGIDPGATKVFTYKINVPKEKFGNYKNEVVVTKGDNTTMKADATVPCTCNIVYPADLVLTKTGESLCNDDNTANPSATQTYTITIKNNGKGSGKVTKIEDTLDSKVVTNPTEVKPPATSYSNRVLTWIFSPPLVIDPGATKAFTYKVNITKEGFGVYNNVVRVTREGGNPLEARASVNTTCNIVLPSDLVLTKVGSSQCFNENTNEPYAVLSYTIKLVNNGEGDGEVARIVDTLDNKTVSDPTDISDGGVYADGKITWVFNPPLVLKKNEEKMFTYKITVAKENFGAYRNTVVATKGDGSTIETEAITECLCNLPPSVPSDIPAQPQTGLFDNSQSIVILGSILLFTGLGWTWLTNSYITLKKKVKTESKSRFERRVVK